MKTIHAPLAAALAVFSLSPLAVQAVTTLSGDYNVTGALEVDGKLNLDNGLIEFVDWKINRTGTSNISFTSAHASSANISLYVLGTSYADDVGSILGYYHSTDRYTSLGLRDSVGQYFIRSFYYIDAVPVVRKTEFYFGSSTPIAGFYGTGDFGIGTASPSAKLHVAGTSYFDGTMTITGEVSGAGVTTTSAAGKLVKTNSSGKIDSGLLDIPSSLLSTTGDGSQLTGLTKAQVGLGNVDNTSDVNKPVSAAQQTAIDLRAVKTTVISAGSGLAGGGDLAANRTLSLSAASSASLAKADTALQPTGSGAALTGLTKTQVGLGNVDNVSDANKPVSVAQQAAIDLKAAKTVTITAGEGLVGGGDLSANRTLSLSAATLAALANAGNGLAADGDGSQLTGITAEQVGAISNDGGEIITDGSGNLTVVSLTLSAPAGDISMGIYGEQ